MKKRLFDFLWFLIIVFISLVLFKEELRNKFIYLTKNYILIMSFLKFSILATMGELLSGRILINSWDFKNIHLKAFVWGVFGIAFSFVFPIYSTGVNGLIESGRLFLIGDYSYILNAFFISFFMNFLFAFPMMVTHRFLDELIGEGKLFSKWDILKTWNKIDWHSMFYKVLPTVFWFWIPIHTVTFLLKPEFRLIMAAFLSICLGLILSFIKKLSKI
jgi:hypothetical protein